MPGFSIQIDSIYRNVKEYPYSTEFVVYNSTYGSSNFQTYMENQIYYQYRWYGNRTLWFPGYANIQTQFNGSISGNIMTVTSILTTTYNGKPSGSLAIGQVITNVLLSTTTPTTVVSGTTIVAFGSGTGSIGTYYVSISQSVASSVMTTNYNSAYQNNNAILSNCSNVISTTVFQLPSNYAAQDVNFFDGLLFAVPKTFSSNTTLTGIFGEVGNSSILPVYGIVGIQVQSQLLGFPSTLNQYNTQVYIDPPPFGGEQATAYANFGVSPSSTTGWDLLSITMTNYGSGYLPSFPPFIYIQSSLYQGTSTISGYDPVYNLITLSSALSTDLLLTTGTLPFAIFNPSNLFENNLNVLGTNQYQNIYSQNYLAQSYLRNGMSTRFWVQDVSQGWTQKILSFLDDNFRYVEVTTPMITLSSSLSALFIGTIDGNVLTVESVIQGTISVQDFISSIASTNIVSEILILAELTPTTFVLANSYTITSSTLFIATTISLPSQPASSYNFEMNDLFQIRGDNVASTIFLTSGTTAFQSIYSYTFLQKNQYSYSVGETVYAIPIDTTLSTSLLVGYDYASYLITQVAYSDIPAYQNIKDIVEMKLLNPGANYANYSQCFLIPSTTIVFLSSYNTILVTKTAYSVAIDFSSPGSVLNATTVQNQSLSHQNQDILSYIVYAPKHYVFPIPASSSSSTGFDASFRLNSTSNQIQASISGTTMNVTSVTPPTGILKVGQQVYGGTVASDTFITKIITGSGGIGTYQLNNSQIVPPSSLSVTTQTSESNMIMTIQGPEGVNASVGQLLQGQQIPKYSSIISLISASPATTLFNVYFPVSSLVISYTTLFSISNRIMVGPTVVSITGYIQNNVLTVLSVTPPIATPIQIGVVMTGNGISYDTRIVSIITGIGGIGTYTVSVSQNTSTSLVMYPSNFVKTFQGTIPYSSTTGTVSGSILQLPAPVAGIVVNQYLSSPSLQFQAQIIASVSPTQWKITQYLDSLTITPYTLIDETSPYVYRIFDIPTFYVSFRFLSFIENFLFYDLYNLNYSFNNVFNFVTNDAVVAEVVGTLYDSSPPYKIDADKYIELIPVKQRPIGLDMPLVADNQPVCYSINLVSLSIPNQPVVGLSVLPSYFPYILVEMQNTSGLATAIQPITSNNPYTNSVNFVCQIGNPLNQDVSNFLVVYAFQTVTLKFLPGDHIRIRISLPNGETMFYIYDEEQVMFSQNPQLADLAFLSNFYTTFPANNITLNFSFTKV